MQLAGIFIYPVKGCRGISLPGASMDSLGIVGDRRFLIVDPNGKFLTQRTHPRMALIAAELNDRVLTLSHPSQGPLDIPRASDPSALLLSVEVWKSHGLQAEDCGDEASEWLRNALGTPARLVRIGNAFHRPVKPEKALPGDVVSFADAYPFLLVGKSSLDDLNDRLLGRGEDAVPMDRFRPNLVIAEAPAFAEDTFARLRIGGLTFRAAGPCARCIVTTTDQTTGERLGPEPLRTLAGYRRNPSDASEVIFGQNLIHETKSGILRVGDPVEPL